ncbi:MAG: hypothetical protein ACHQ2E_03880 [Gemmatimonadales bacterium]
MHRTWMLTLTLCAACGPAPAAGSPESGPFHYATARQICAPWDGPGVSIVLANDSLAAETPSPPYLEFRIYQSADLLSARTVRFSGNSSDSGAVMNCTAEGHCDFTDGSIDFGAVHATADLAGHYRVLLGGRWMTGSFRARWLVRRELCG